METYSKLSSSLIHSTVWREPDHVRLVWITMLAIADRHGVVRASVPGLADAARVSLDSTIEALKRFSGPDQWSRSKVDEGRRIREIKGGWELINHDIYRGLGTSDERRAQVREAARKFRKKHNKSKRNQSNQQNHPDQDQDQDQIRSENRSDPEKEAKAADGLRSVPLTVEVQPGSDASGSEHGDPDPKPKRQPPAKGKTASLFAPAATAPPKPNAQLAIAQFCDAWVMAKEKKYVPTPKDRGQLVQMLKNLSTESIVRLPEMFALYLADDTKFTAVDQGHSLWWFCSNVNKYTPGGKASARKSSTIGNAAPMAHEQFKGGVQKL